MPLQFLIAMWGAWIGLGIIVASEALGTGCLGAGERGHYGTDYGDGRQVPSRISRGHKPERNIPVIRLLS